MVVRLIHGVDRAEPEVEAAHEEPIGRSLAAFAAAFQQFSGTASDLQGDILLAADLVDLDGVVERQSQVPRDLLLPVGVLVCLDHSFTHLDGSPRPVSGAEFALRADARCKGTSGHPEPQRIGMGTGFDGGHCLGVFASALEPGADCEFFVFPTAPGDVLRCPKVGVDHHLHGGGADCRMGAGNERIGDGNRLHVVFQGLCVVGFGLGIDQIAEQREGAGLDVGAVVRVFDCRLDVGDCLGNPPGLAKELRPSDEELRVGRLQPDRLGAAGKGHFDVAQVGGYAGLQPMSSGELGL